MYNFTFHRPTTVRQAADCWRVIPRQALAARAFAAAGDEVVGEPFGADRPSLVEGMSGVEQKGSNT